MISTAFPAAPLLARIVQLSEAIGDLEATNIGFNSLRHLPVRISQLRQ